MHCTSCEFFNECRRWLKLCSRSSLTSSAGLQPIPLSTMKHLTLFTSLLMLFTPNTYAGWLFDDPPPDLGPKYRAKITRLEDRNSEHHATTMCWEIASQGTKIVWHRL